MEVECNHGCGEQFQRCSVVMHETEQCGERPFPCQHCEDYHSTVEDVTKVHHLECDQYPLPCPKRCRESTFERWELKNHLDQCPLALIDCPFHHAGCDVRILLKDLAEHTEKEAVVHLALLARVTENLTRENRELRERATARESEFRDLQQRVYLERRNHSRTVERERTQAARVRVHAAVN